MLRHSLRGLAGAALAAVALGPAPAAAVTELNNCAFLDKAGETYVLTANVSATTFGGCFTIRADRITLDLGGHTITGFDPGFGAGVWDENALRIHTVVKNGTFTNFGWGSPEGEEHRGAASGSCLRSAPAARCAMSPWWRTQTASSSGPTAS
jgi:hypothetical protein